MNSGRVYVKGPTKKGPTGKRADNKRADKPKGPTKKGPTGKRADKKKGRQEKGPTHFFNEKKAGFLNYLVKGPTRKRTIIK
jgi:hypothetical protein